MPMNVKENARKTCAALLALCLLAVCLLTGCGGAGSRGEEELPDVDSSALGQAIATRKAVDSVFSLNYDPAGSMNPLRATSAANAQFWSLLYDSVFTVDEDFQFSSDIVTEYTSEDYGWWTFTVRQDLRFSDGTPLTAKDVAYSIIMAKTCEVYSARLKCVYGCSAMGDEMFAISTTRPNSRLPALLNIPIIPINSFEEDFPAGTGPYMLNISHDTLVRNPESRYRSLPVEQVYLRDFMDTSARITAFEDSRIDIVSNDPTGMYNLGYGSTNETRYFDTTNLHYIGFNTRSNYFQFFRTRCAVGRLVDRSYVVKELLNGCGTEAALAVHPRSGLYDEEYAQSLAYNPETAAALFEASGVGDLDGDGELEIMVTGIVVEFRIRFIVNNDSAAKVEAARRLTDELNKLGITTTLYELSWEDFLTALEEGNYDMYYGEVRMAMDWDLSYLFEVAEPDKNGKVDWKTNYARNSDTAYVDLYGNYLASSDVSRYENFQTVSHYIADSGIIIPICFERRQVLTHRGAIENLHATQFELFFRFPEWQLYLNQQET